MERRTVEFSQHGNFFMQQISGDLLQAVFQGSTEFSELSEPGVWLIENVIAGDMTGNEQIWSTQALATRGFPTELNVVAPPADTTPPVLVAFDFDPKEIDTTQGPATVHFTATATDDLSGVESVRGGLVSASGSQHGHFFMRQVSGDPLRAVFEGTAELPQFSELGVWQIENVIAGDQAGNERFWLPEDLVALGFPTSLNNAPQGVEAKINILEDAIRSLVNCGALELNKANPLFAFVRSTRRAFDQGNLHGALIHLQSFDRKVRHWIDKQILSASDGEQLLDMAGTVADMLLEAE